MRKLERDRNDSLNGGGNDVGCGDPENAKSGVDSVKLMGILLAVLAIFSFMFSFFVVHYEIPYRGFYWGRAEAWVFRLQQSEFEPIVLEDYRSWNEEKVDKLFHGLLSPGFDDKSCASRSKSASYRKRLLHNPSSPLISKLRSYESLHKRCGPHTGSYREALDLLSSGKRSGPSDCNYLVWVSNSGLGNRILTLASAFLYALLTNRVLLVDRGRDIADLFCEPFPEASWLLPKDFPLADQFEKYNQKSNQSYGNMLKTNVLENVSDAGTPSSLYLHLGLDYDDRYKIFFCDQDQSFFQKVPWLIMKTDHYFIPSLFLIPTFEQELSNLFPEKERVFHFLGRYLFHPTDEVWGLIMRYYIPYLSSANERIGIQARVFDTEKGPKQHIFEQILSCVQKEGILPWIPKQEHNMDSYETKAVLVTSLDTGYVEQLQDIYWENRTTTGVSFFRLSHEQYQQNDKQLNNKKAWAEMYLLSLTDKLVTSSCSTFGYVAQGLGGLRPWILIKPENQTAPDPPCVRAMSMEPCFHAPVFYDCKKKTVVDAGSLVPHVRHCEDMRRGIKLVDSDFVKNDL